ncbi:MAG: hypothetical protein AAB897_03770 [Patescibacteria group bacterium]
MQVHNFTDEQMSKFIDAVGGAPKTEIAGGQFTTEDLRKLVESVNGLNDWPKTTDDPRVNYAIDCVVDDTGDEDEAGYDEKLYTEEVAAFATLNCT